MQFKGCATHNYSKGCQKVFFSKMKKSNDDQSKKKVALTIIMATSEKLKESSKNFVFIIYSLMKMACFGYVD
jgi:hypothetical protein